MPKPSAAAATQGVSVTAHAQHLHTAAATQRFEGVLNERDDRWAYLLLSAARAMADTASAASFKAAQEAFSEFYTQSAHLALSVARRVAGDNFAEDVLAETYIQAWRNLHSFDAQRGRASAWLLTMVRSRALDKLRFEALRRAEPLAHEHEGDDDGDTAGWHGASLPTDPATGPEALLASTESRTLLHRALADLSHKERWVLSLAYFKDLSHSEISNTTGLPLGTVKTLASRAIAKLRLSLSELQAPAF